MNLLSFILIKYIYTELTMNVLERVYGSWVIEKTLEKRINWYRRVLILSGMRLKFNLFKFWIKNPYKILAFILLLVVNTPLRLVYLCFYLIHIPYWLSKLLRYVWSRNPIDLKPINRDPSFESWYLVFLYRVTWKRAHLNSYNSMYIVLHKLIVRQKGLTVFQVLIRTPFILFWYTFIALTSTPRQVVLDSYTWSKRFTKKKHYLTENTISLMV